MARYRLTRIARAPGRVVFDAPVAPGNGEHDYVCAECATPLLTRVGIRYPSGAVFRCGSCGALNVVAPLKNVPDEIRDRMDEWRRDCPENTSGDRR